MELRRNRPAKHERVTARLTSEEFKVFEQLRKEAGGYRKSIFLENLIVKVLQDYTEQRNQQKKKKSDIQTPKPKPSRKTDLPKTEPEIREKITAKPVLGTPICYGQYGKSEECELCPMSNPCSEEKRNRFYEQYTKKQQEQRKGGFKIGRLRIGGRRL